MAKFENYFEHSTSPEEQMELQRRADHALAPRNKDGLIIPIIPDGPGPAADMAGQIYYPSLKPDENGCVPAIIFDQDFADGQLPDYMEYAPGWERPDRPYDGKTLDGIVYCDPVRNLSSRDQFLLAQARNSPQLYTPAIEGFALTPPVAIVTPIRQVFSVPQGMAVQTPDGAAELLSNFQVKALQRRIIRVRGEPDAEEFELEVSLMGTVIGQITVSAANLDNLVPIIVKRYPACHTHEDATKANLRIANSIRDQIPALPTITIIKTPGFIRLGGTWVYAHDGAVFNGPVEFRTGCTIPCDPQISREQALRAALGVLELMEDSAKGLPLLLEAHLGLLYNLFEVAGFAPKFVMFVYGQTGSLKTAVTLALFRLFKELPATPEATFRDTKTALEVKIGAACSRVLVVDDLQPAVTSAAGRESAEKLEHVIRIFGDGIAKSRSNSELGRAKEFHPAGCCVVTGEDTGGSQSSLLRCLVIHIQKGEIDGSKLRFYQEHPEVLQTHFFHFLAWAGAHGEEIAEYIRNRFQQEREFFSKVVSEPRQADIGATMLLTARIFVEYIKSIMPLETSELAAIEKFWVSALVETIGRSEDETVGVDPVRMYLEALLDGQATGKINIAPDQAAFIRGRHHGFAKDSCWWLFPKDIYAYVTRHWKEQGTNFPLKTEQVHALLRQADLLDVSRENRKGKEQILCTKKSTLEGRPRMLVLRVDQAREYLENSN